MQKKILIVDDEPMIRDIFRDAFEMKGFIVDEAETGREAFEIIQNTKYHCVLSDIRMPGGDGIDLAKRVHQMTGPKPKMFLVTGYTDMNIKSLRNWGVLAIFDKPFNFREILDVVGSSIEVDLEL
jgi:two-component system response regulator PilR (NtrC family)